MEERRLTVYAELKLLVPLPLLSLVEQPIEVPPPNSWLDSSMTRRFERRGEGAHIPMLSPEPENVYSRGQILHFDLFLDFDSIKAVSFIFDASDTM